MNSETYKLKFGVSKTTYKNMKKNNLITPTETIESSIAAYKEIRKGRQRKQRKLEMKNLEASRQHRKLMGKPRKRHDGKVEGSVGPRKHTA